MVDVDEGIAVGGKGEFVGVETLWLVAGGVLVAIEVGGDAAVVDMVVFGNSVINGLISVVPCRPCESEDVQPTTKLPANINNQ